MAKKQALGRGLSALLTDHQPKPKVPQPTDEARGSEEVVGQMAGDIALLEVSCIEANQDQPRRDFEATELNRLAQSIGELGIIQPITVRRIRANKYQIISGERRFRAAQLAGLDVLPAYIREVDDQTLLVMALVENIQRQDLHAMEIAASFQRLLDECNLTQDELAKRIGKDRSTISNYINLMRLPAEMQLAVARRDITMGHARALKGIEDIEWQKEVFDLILKETLSVRQTEELAKNNLWDVDGPNPAATRLRNRKMLSSFERKASEELKRKFGSTTKLKSNGQGAGKIEFKYKSEEELDVILELLNL